MTRGQRRGFRIAFAVLPAGLLLAGVAAIFVAHHHYRLEWLANVAVAFWLGAFAAVGVLGFAAFESRAVRAIAVAISLFGVLGAVYVVMVVRYTLLEGERQVVNVVQSPDGRYELVVEDYSVLIDPAHDVWLRERHGLFARKVRLWTSREGPAPGRVAFVGQYEVEIVDNDKNQRRSTFDPATLRPSEVHCLGSWC